jgi:uncharacterized protein YkwD
VSARMLMAITWSLLGLATAPGAAASDVTVPDAIYDLPLDGGAEEVASGGTIHLAPAVAGSATVRAVNRARERHGLRRLRRSRSLGSSARRYAVWMLRVDYFGHLSHIRASRRFRRLGEALTIWFRDPGLAPDADPGAARRAQVEKTVRGWLDSPPHRRLLLSRHFTKVGAGYAAGFFRERSATTWVLHFGA